MGDKLNMSASKNRIRIEYFLMLIASFFWAIGHPLGRIILEKVHPFQLGTITLATGIIGLLIFLIISGRIKKIASISRRDIFISLGIGVLGFFLYQVLTFSALSRIPASVNAMLVSINVVFIVIFAAIILKEKINIIQGIGIFLAITGVLFVTFNNGFNINAGGGNINLLGGAFSLLAALSASLYSVIGKKILESNDPLIITAIGFSLGHIKNDIVTLVILVTIITILVSSYLTTFLGYIYNALQKQLSFFENKNCKKEKTKNIKFSTIKPVKKLKVFTKKI